MNEHSLHERVFPVKLASWLEMRYGSYMGWIKHLLARLGRDSFLLTIFKHSLC
jgi:hypothetical protein